MPHLIERFGAGVARQLGEAPVLLHLGVQKVLIDRGEFTGQLFVQKAQNIGITLHDRSSILPWHGFRLAAIDGEVGLERHRLPGTNLVQ